MPIEFPRSCSRSFEEVEYERRGELFDLEAARPDAEPVGGEADQQLEAGDVALDRVPAGRGGHGAGNRAGTH